MGIRYFSFYLGTFLFVSVVGAAAWAEGPFGIKPSAVPGLSQWNTVERLPDGREGLISWTRDRSGKIRGNLDSIRQSNGVFSSAQVREYLAGASPQAPAKVAPAKPVEKPVEKPAEKKVEKPKEATSGPVRRTFEPELPQLPKEIPLARAPRVVAPPSIPSVTVPDLPKRDAGFKTPQGIIPKFSRTEPTDFPGVSKQTEYYAPQVNGNGVVSIKRPSDKAIVLGSQVLPLSGGKKQVIIQQENGLKVKREFSLDEQGSVQSKITHVEAGPRNNPWYPVKEGEPVSILHTANPTDTKATARSFVSSDGVVKDVVLDPKTNQWQKVEPPKKGFDRESLVQSLETTEKNLLAQVSEARKKQEQTEREVASGYQGAFPRVIADAVRPLVQSATSVDFSSVMQEAAKKIPGKAGSAHGLPMNVVLGAEEKPSKVAILAATGREGRLDVQTAIQSLQEGDLKKSFQSGMQSYLGGFNRALSAFSSKAPETPSFLKPYQEVVSDSVQNSSSVTLAKAVGTVFQKSVQGNLALASL